MTLRHSALKALGWTLIFSAIRFLAAAPAGATMHWGNPCYGGGGGSYPLSWFSQLFGFFVLLLGVYVFFGATVTRKIKEFLRSTRRR